MCRVLLFLPMALVLLPPAVAAPVPAAPKDNESVPLATAKLLKYRKVQKELKMTAEQRINILDAMQDIEEEYERKLLALDKLPNVPDDAFQKVEKDRMKSIEKALSTAAEKSLTPAQRVRLRQVGWQVMGPAAFAEPQVQKALQLDDGAKRAAAALAEAATQKGELYLSHLGDDDEDKVRAEVLAFRKDGAKDFLKLLSAAQQETWKTMLGDPVRGFDADELWLRVVEDADNEIPE